MQNKYQLKLDISGFGKKIGNKQYQIDWGLLQITVQQA